MKKRILSLLMAIVMVCSLLPVMSMPAHAATYTGKIGNNITWVYDSATSTMTLSGIGEMADYTGSLYSDHVSSIYGVSPKTVVISEGITSIGAYRFYQSGSIQKVVLPSTLVEIGNSAFYNCDKLTTVEMSEGVQKIGLSAFYDCDALVKIDFPDSITHMGNYAFYSCGALPNFEFPASLTEIGRDAFAYCNKLTAVELPENLTKLGDYAFGYCSNLTALSHLNTVYRHKKAEGQPSALRR